MSDAVRITPFGALGEVTGSGYLVETRSARVLVDFGLFQGSRGDFERNLDVGPVRPAELDAVVLTHAHLDHSGRLPLLVRHGFTGPVHATSATLDIAELLLEDSARIQASDAARETRRRRRAGIDEPYRVLYEPDDARGVSERGRRLAYGERREVADGVSVTLHEAGHILGSASVVMEVAGRRIVFSGDIGPHGMPFIRNADPPTEADLVFLESTYGDRDHRPLADTVEELKEVLGRCAWEREKVLIPSFAIGRAQQLLYHIAELVRGGRVPTFPIYLDSPMAAKALDVYAVHERLFDDEAAALVRQGALRRDLRELSIVQSVQESIAINELWERAVVIAGSGMCDGGRIVHHLKHNLWRRNVTVLIVGYQARGSLGRRLVDGADHVRIHRERIAVRATVRTLGGFSAHAGQSELVAWLGAMAGSRPRVVLTHGEDGPRAALAESIRARHGLEAETPGPGTVIELA